MAEAILDGHEKRHGRSPSLVSSSTETGDDSRNATLTELAPVVTRRASVAPDEARYLTQLASRDNAVSRVNTLAEISLDDPALNPDNKDFDLYKWLRKVVHVLNEEGVPRKKASIFFQHLRVSGTGAALQLQQTVADLFTAPFRPKETFNFGSKTPKTILHNFDGVLHSGELLIVLGRPGSGCSTFLKTLSGELNGLHVDEKTVLHYSGIPQKTMIKEFKGEVVYNQEVDKHFPHLTVGQTLEFAASVRTPAKRLHGMSRAEYAQLMTKVVMAVFGLSHTYNTKVGNDTVRGVSGGERKRVSIAEMALAGAPLAAWDNSTRGLDSATALKFVESLRLAADLGGSAHAVAIYQASQAIYDLFDKAVVLYEGRQIYFGPASKAKAFFERQGWFCPPRQTSGDFLTSVTNPVERQARPGMESKVPRTAAEFEAYWHQSDEYKALHREMAVYQGEVFSQSQEKLLEFQQQKREEQASHTRAKSPYLISIPMQIKLNTKRAYQRVWNERTSTITTYIGNCILALIVGSVFYGTPTATAGFYAKGATLFYAVLLNALTAMTEINSLYSQRPIVEKHASFAFYHPATEAIAGVVSDIPVKFLMAVAFNIILYFLSNLRREASQFFIYFLITFIIMFVMSAVFRTMAAITKTVSQAMTLAGILILALVVYTGFVVPVGYMKPWFKWIHYLNPIFYAFEILVANEFHGREFTCSEFVPAYPDLTGDSFICSARGAVAGRRTVSGDAYIQASFNYSYSHVWRNFGILMAFLIGFMTIYFVATELNSSTTSTAEVLVFRRGHEPASLKNGQEPSADEEAGSERTTVSSAGEENKQDQGISSIPPQQDIFTWRDVVYDIEIKGEPRRLLDHVSGWVKPGTLTALMGVSGAGKTTLLDVLAHRTTMGVITGDMFVNGHTLDSSFQRKTGYVQQQDLHLETATVRESLRFSAMLRQPASVSKEEKYAYVEEVIKMLNMEEFAEAVVGVPGEGLNVEQRKLLTIGVELAAKPKLLLFLDEPTSGLDSQSSWAICNFLRKLADSGQAILCTIHQPSAILFEQFDRLLFLARGGKTVYFGPIGENSRTLLDYFESHGAPPCGDQENPAEYMLEVVNAGTNPQGENWFDLWKGSKEAAEVQAEIDRIHEAKRGQGAGSESANPDDRELEEFAIPFFQQLPIVTTRVFQQYWRLPMYIVAKMMLGLCAGLFIGFSFFNADSSLQGMQNAIFSVFMLCAIFSSLVQQIIPLFITQRALYEVRERPSKTYSWKAFMIANIVVEIPYQIVMGVIVFGCYYYAVDGIQSSDRQGLILLFCLQFFIYASTFADMVIAALPDAETAGAIVTLLFSMALTFNGVMQTPEALPGFWIFMYRASPFTYWVGGVVATQMHGRAVQCNAAETAVFNPPSGQTCEQYLAKYMSVAPGYLNNPNATSSCEYCSVSVADQYLSSVSIHWDERWRNFGIFWVYIVFDIAAAVLLYYCFRVKKWDFSFGKGKKKESSKKQ
ncbi:putative ABC multidrug transporter [Aspergillus clavatus NRRL 1]|uniref:ABC multidrug transporter, putative n=1 Tax=Aspergillus clavatus (strain ATCC 1007 / CBS 513.65 / DSM 816 / NCTC 3887 / NRRL 1 / QM 1276 / 107) TaxID=344612 RepID=A1CJJ7_ASPCL|nr:ABC multidrug transporter, putative [Aspergillus clavatus NRRL 1]EAW09321.1 ABC multidrug transporter, putative [Aspergillus clavatus NRRL 1]